MGGYSKILSSNFSSGVFCESVKNCDIFGPLACKNGGNCIIGENSYCDCPPAFYGTLIGLFSVATTHYLSTGYCPSVPPSILINLHKMFVFTLTIPVDADTSSPPGHFCQIETCNDDSCNRSGKCSEDYEAGTVNCDCNEGIYGMVT